MRSAMLLDCSGSFALLFCHLDYRSMTKECFVSDHVYKHIDVTGTSEKSSDDAVRTALARAGKSIHGMKWFKIIETRGDIDGDAVMHWQVTVQIGFTIDD